jgi:arylsulfatase A-like enzyme
MSVSNQPNIIICTADQLPAYATGCYGNDFVRTPNLDRLAGEGMRFDQAVSNYPVCLPARSILISGQHNRTCTGGMSNVVVHGEGRDFYPQYPFPDRPHLKDKALPEVLREGGYDTATIGKWHIHSWPHDVGFDNYIIPRVNHCHTGQAYTENGSVEFVPPGYSVDYEADRLEQFLEGRSEDDKPFFMYYNISPPHCPFGDAPEKYLKMYDPAEVPIRPNVDPDTPLKDQEMWFNIYRWDFRYYTYMLPETTRLPDGYSLRHLTAEYYGLVTWVDDTVGRMLNVLDRTGLAENTIVVFTADHGENLGSLGLVQKGGPNEESIRIPMIVRGPGACRGVNQSHVGSLVDLAPALLSMSGLEAPSHFQGRDLSPLCRGEACDAPIEAYVEHGWGATVRTLDQTYHLPCASSQQELADTPGQYYDMNEDPYQMNNLAAAGELPAGAGELDQLLRAWDERTPWGS